MDFCCGSIHYGCKIGVRHGTLGEESEGSLYEEQNLNCLDLDTV
jgi:hypothetical protein